MSARHHFDANLKRLKLSGMLFNLDMRLSEASENELSYLEFLTLLVQDEISQRDNNMFMKRVKAARFVRVQTFESFDFKFNSPHLPASQLRELATCRFIDLRENVVLAGPPGIGKTHIIRAIGHEACRKGHHVLFIKAHKLMDDLLNAKAYGKYEREMKKCIKVDLLALDDFAFKKLTPQEAEIFYTLIDERLGMGSTIVTSNRPPQDWINIFPDMVMGGAILDRLVSGATKLMATTKAKSFRKEGKKHLDETIKKE